MLARVRSSAEERGNSDTRDDDESGSRREMTGANLGSWRLI